jgi:UTP--glucose-1-phosphate uridylyltransferase
MPIDLAVVPVAGRGTRLLPLTKSQPKEMLPVGRKPVVQYVVEELARCGVGRLLFVTGPGKTAIENHFDIDAELIDSLRQTGKEELLAELAFEREDLEYFYTRQRRQLGLGHAVLCARSVVGRQPFVVALGDSIIGLCAQSTVVRTMIQQYEARGADVVVAFEEVPREEVVHYGIAQPRDGAGDVFRLDDLVEKPEVAEAPSTLAVAARYVLSPAIFDCLEKTPPGKGDEIQLTDAIRMLIREGGRAYGVRLPHDQRRFDIGNFESYFEAFAEFALADPQHGPALRGHLAKLLEAGKGDAALFSHQETQSGE